MFDSHTCIDTILILLAQETCEKIVVKGWISVVEEGNPIVQATGCKKIKIKIKIKKGGMR